jgi:sulfatase modifying factor 1
MVDVEGRYCIDRWEMSLTDARTGRDLSPYYNPNPELALRDHREWQRKAAHSVVVASRSMPLPELADFALDPSVAPRAVSAPDRVPAAYLDLESARSACQRAGKRLCRRDEWIHACRGEHQARFGYGAQFDAARCNVDAPVHPASLLHGASALGLTDPRLNQVEYDGRTLLRPTGTLLGCAAAWGDDAVYDMVGNLDEWIDDPDGTFLGGFYARETHWGCDARIEVHSADYYDYSIGARCCAQTR